MRFRAFRNLLLGLVALLPIGLALTLLIWDVKRTREEPLPEPRDIRLAREDFAELEDPAKGWFPAVTNPVFGWESGDDGWKLEADDPLALIAVAPVYPGLPSGESGPQPSTSQPSAPETSEPQSRSPQTSAPPSSQAPTPAVSSSQPSTRESSSSGPAAAAPAEATTAEAPSQEKKAHWSSERASQGTHSLSVPVHFPDPTSVFRKPPGLSGVRFIAYDVYVPSGTPGYIGCLFFMKDKDGRWYQARSRAPLRPGAWTTVTADLRGGSADVEPLGHLGQWDENQASQVETVGLTFYGDQPFEGMVWIDNFRAWMPAERFAKAVAALPPPELLGSDAALTPEHREELQVQAAKAEAYRPEPPLILNFRTEPLTPVPSGQPAASSAPPVPPQVGCFQIFTVRFELNREFFNPFDPEQVDVRARVEPPAGEPYEVLGFWYQEFDRTDRFAGDALRPLGRPEWRIRIAPRVPGPHRVQVSVRIRGETDPLSAPSVSFLAMPSSNPGFLRVSAADPSYFEFENGTFFYPIGHNVHSPVDLRCWNEIYKQPPPLNRGTLMYRDFFPKMKAAGENVGEVWMSSWWLGLEWTRRWQTYHGPGRYSLEHAWLLDRILEMARQNGLLLHLVIDNHGKFSQWCDWEWDQNPYNRMAEPGGMVSSPTEFFTNERARQLHRQRLRYIAARWGCDSTLLGWEMVSEMDLVGDGRPGRDSNHGSGNRGYFRTPEPQAWVSEMITALKSYDPYHHPVTVHYATDFNWVDRKLAETPLFDYIVGDAYRDVGQYRTYANMARAWGQAFGQARKPFWITEFGGNWNATVPARLEADLHCGLWSSWMTSAGGTPLFWWYDFVDQSNLYGHFRAFAQYAAGEDRRGLNGSTEDLLLTPPNPALTGIQYRWKDGAYAWIYDQNLMQEMTAPEIRQKHAGCRVEIPGLEEGSYRVEYWDTYTGKVIQEEKLEVSGGQHPGLTLPLSPAISPLRSGAQKS